MGACGTKGVKKPETSLRLSMVPYKNPTNYIIKIIQPSLLYSLISKDLNREISGQNKDHEYIDCRAAAKFKASHLKSAINIDLSNLKENKENLFKSLKILLDFKNLILVGENLVSFDNDLVEGLFDFFKSLESAKISLNRIYVFNGNIKDILNEYPYFSQTHQTNLKEKYLPFLLYSAQDKVPRIKKDALPIQDSIQDGDGIAQKIYIQDYQKFKQSFNEEMYYNTLGIRAAFITFKSLSLDDLNIKYTTKEKSTQYDLALENNKKFQIYTEDLTNLKEAQSILKTLYNKKSPFLVVHESKKAESVIIQLVNFLKVYEKIEFTNLQSYIEERIPKISSSQVNAENNKKLEKIQEKKSPKKLQSKVTQDENTLSRQEELNQQMALLKKSCKSHPETFEEIYNLISKILDNMIKNPEEEKYKTLNESNPKLKQTIFKFDSSKKIMEILGFRKKEETQYYNPLDVSNLKHIKIEIDIAYKNSCNN